MAPSTVMTLNFVLLFLCFRNVQLYEHRGMTWSTTAWLRWRREY